MNKLTKWVAAGLLLLGSMTTASAAALSAKPMRVGPVQNYGALGTEGSKIVSLVNGKQVMLRGMSWYWSDALGIQYYKKEVVKWAAEELGIDVIRFAMGIEYYDNGQKKMDEAYSYMGSKESYKAKLDQMIEAAIESDIYIIVDWHSHLAHQETSDANAFFKEIAAKYANVPNVIYEVYNEPVINDWGTIKNYAQTVVGSIRSSTNNLVLVGTGFYSQNPGAAANDPLSYKNVAYVLHFYAGSHSKGSFSGTIESAMSKNQAVFISEWGTTNANGAGAPDQSATQEWLTYMDSKQISNCNWSLRQYTSDIDNSSEESAMFDGSSILGNRVALENAKYTASGSIVKSYLQKNKRSWADSLVAGKTGACSFASQTAKETDGSISNALKAGCTYTSSDESVATANGTDIEIRSPGYAIFTATDGSQSIVVIDGDPEQTINGVTDFVCHYKGSCSQKHTLGDMTSSGKSEAILTTNSKTDQGGSFTITALNPEIVDVSLQKCTGSKCFGSKDGMVYICEFKQFGDAKVAIKAPAITGFRAIDDTITITYAKGLQKIHSKFKSQTIPLGGTAQNALPDTLMFEHAQVTYTYNGNPTTPYFTKSGTSIIAGSENAIVLVKATAPETDLYEAFESTAIIVIGDSTLAVNKEEFEIIGIEKQRPKASPLHATIANSMLNVNSNAAGNVNVKVFSLTGQNVMNATIGSNASLSLASIARGTYLIEISQGKQLLRLKWNRK